MNKIYPLTNKRKKKIYIKIIEKLNDIFDIDYLNKCLRCIESLEDIDIGLLLREKTEIYFKCKFIDGNFAWISKNNKNKYRYFSKGYITYSLDIYDILTILFNCKFSQLLGVINELFPENLIKNTQMNQIKLTSDNVAYMTNLIEDDINIKKVLKNRIDIYMALNDFCSQNVLIEQFYKSSPIFFISTRYLKEKYQLKYSISTINQTVNLYSWLGIINKVPEGNINCDLYKEYSDRKSKDNKASISFYSMPSLLNLKEELKTNCTVMNNNNMTYYDIKQSRQYDLFKYDIFPVYNKNRGGGQKKKRAKECEKQKETLEESFEKELVEKGYVLKELITSELNMSTTVINKKWKELLIDYDLISVKPTKKVKERLNLKTNLEIAIRKGVRLNEL